MTKKPIKYEIAMPKGKKCEDFGKSGAWTFFGVDTGLACFSDAKVAKEYSNFITKWQNENPSKNKYNDYFATLFQKVMKCIQIYRIKMAISYF